MTVDEYDAAVAALERGEHPPFFDAIQPRGWGSRAHEDAATALYDEIGRRAVWQPWCAQEMRTLRDRLWEVIQRERDRSDPRRPIAASAWAAAEARLQRR